MCVPSAGWSMDTSLLHWGVAMHNVGFLLTIHFTMAGEAWDVDIVSHLCVVTIVLLLDLCCGTATVLRRCALL